MERAAGRRVREGTIPRHTEGSMKAPAGVSCTARSETAHRVGQGVLKIHPEDSGITTKSMMSLDVPYTRHSSRTGGVSPNSDTYVSRRSRHSRARDVLHTLGDSGGPPSRPTSMVLLNTTTPLTNSYSSLPMPVRETSFSGLQLSVPGPGHRPPVHGPPGQRPLARAKLRRPYPLDPRSQLPLAIRTGFMDQDTFFQFYGRGSLRRTTILT